MKAKTLTRAKQMFKKDTAKMQYPKIKLSTKDPKLKISKTIYNKK